MQVTHRTTSPLSSHHLSPHLFHSTPVTTSPVTPCTTHHSPPHHLTGRLAGALLHMSRRKLAEAVPPRASSARCVRLLYLDAAAPSMAYGATCGALSEALFAEALAGGAAAAVLGTAASTAFCMSSGTAR